MKKVWVTIKKSSGKQFWYADKIGQQFEIMDEPDKDGDYTLADDYNDGNAGTRLLAHADIEFNKNGEEQK